MFKNSVLKIYLQSRMKLNEVNKITNIKSILNDIEKYFFFLKERPKKGAL